MTGAPDTSSHCPRGGLAKKIRNCWIRLHSTRQPGRFIIKAAIIGVTILAVCFPYPHILARQLKNMRNVERLIDPDAPELAEFRERLQRLYDSNPDPERMTRFVQELVYRKIPYAFDWETWGVVDYWPTVAEAMRMGREDCDGRAVVAASLLRGIGIDAELVFDGSHVWVRTPHGSTMSPNEIETWRATDDGYEFDWRGLKLVPRNTAYGLAVFPFARELIVLLVVVAMLSKPGRGWRRPSVAVVLLVLGLWLLRTGAINWHQFNRWAIAGAVLFGATGFFLLLFGRSESDEPPHPDESTPA